MVRWVRVCWLHCGSVTLANPVVMLSSGPIIQNTSALQVEKLTSHAMVHLKKKFFSQWIPGRVECLLSMELGEESWGRGEASSLCLSKDDEVQACALLLEILSTALTTWQSRVQKRWSEHMLRRFSIDLHFPTEPAQKSRWLQLRRLQH